MLQALARRRYGIVVPALAGLAIALLISSISTAQEAPTERRGRRGLEEGFTRLIQNGEKTGWVGYGSDTWPAGWEVDGSTLHRAGGGGDIMTEKEYGDFDLRFGWKVSEGGNSGVMYRVSQEQAPAYFTGPEYQVLDNAQHPDGKNPVTSAGSLYGLYAPSEDVAKPAGQWNRGRIVLRGDRVQHFLNGKKVVDAQIGGEEWNKLVGASKFAAWPKFGKNARGHIVLQDHGDKVWYRNIRIKELGPENGEQ